MGVGVLDHGVHVVVPHVEVLILLVLVLHLIKLYEKV